MCFFFFKQETAYELRISDWSSDVCSSELHRRDIDDPSTPYHPGDGVLGYEQEALDVGIENAVEIGLAQRFDIAFRSHSGIIHKAIETLCTARKELLVDLCKHCFNVFRILKFRDNAKAMAPHCFILPHACGRPLPPRPT